MKSDQVAPGGFELRTLKERVLIVGDPIGVLSGVEAFLTKAPNYIPANSTETGTDFVVAPGKLAKRTRTSNRLGLDLGPGSGDATVTIDELQIFGHDLTETEVIRLSD